MRRLPPLLNGSQRLRLPLCDRSASLLARVLLSERRDEFREPLAAQLAIDPPLAVWCAATAWREEGFQASSLEGLAAWFLAKGVGALCWPESPTERDEPVAEKADQRIARSVALAALAFRLATENVETARRCQLDALLAEPWQWCDPADAEVTAAGTEDVRLPPSDSDATASRVVAQARTLIDGAAKMPDTLATVTAACRQQGDEARRQWLAHQPDLAEQLPTIARRMARLAELEDEFATALEQAKLAAMAEFAAGAGHEINNPLTVITGRAQLLLKEETHPERRHALALMHTQAMRVHEMIADMRLFARPPRPEFQPLDLSRLLPQVVEEMRSQAVERGTRIAYTGPAEPCTIEADPTHLTVALRALCRNSLEAVGQGGQIELALKTRGEQVEVTVADDGPGITPEQRPHIFEPFYSGRQAGRGLGLGLSKCWQIVRLHAGQISVDSAVGRGTVFTITLPLSRGKGERRSARVPLPPAGEDGPGATG